jgi:hypothetical protein
LKRKEKKRREEKREERKRKEKEKESSSCHPGIGLIVIRPYWNPTEYQYQTKSL